LIGKTYASFHSFQCVDTVRMCLPVHRTRCSSLCSIADALRRLTGVQPQLHVPHVTGIVKAKCTAIVAGKPDTDPAFSGYFPGSLEAQGIAWGGTFYRFLTPFLPYSFDFPPDALYIVCRFGSVGWWPLSCAGTPPPRTRSPGTREIARHEPGRSVGNRHASASLRSGGTVTPPAAEASAVSQCPSARGRSTGHALCVW
jgi:hypothetical protein